jgi:hypothetical protein
MTEPISYGKGSARWRYISDGYTKYWYLRSAVRWLSIVAAVTALAVFGIVYHDWADYGNHAHSLYLGAILFIVAVSNSLPSLLRMTAWKDCASSLLSAITAASVFCHQCYHSHASVSPAKEVCHQSWMVAIWRPYHWLATSLDSGLQRTVLSRLGWWVLE